MLAPLFSIAVTYASHPDMAPAQHTHKSSTARVVPRLLRGAGLGLGLERQAV